MTDQFNNITGIHFDGNSNAPCEGADFQRKIYPPADMANWSFQPVIIGTAKEATKLSKLSM